jgi:hypothetical protein
LLPASARTRTLSCSAQTNQKLKKGTPIWQNWINNVGLKKWQTHNIVDVQLIIATVIPYPGKHYLKPSMPNYHDWHLQDSMEDICLQNFFQ